jgi:3-phenylpropionate/trans-cinnamate dioxygenase ferredoxin subunit
MAGEYVKVATTDQIKEGQTIVVKIGRDEMVIANVDGQFYAVSDYCPHGGWLLHDERLKGENIPCSLHGSLFSIKTGAIVRGPSFMPLTSYPVRVDGNDVLIQAP